MRKLINDKKKNGEWKIQLKMKINFICSRNVTESGDMYSKSDNFEINMGGNTIEIIRNIFNSILRRYQGGLHESMRGSEFVFDYIESLNYIFHMVDLKRSRSESPEWLKNKGATINCQNDDDKYFQYAIAKALNYDKIGNNHQRVNKVKPLIDQYNWKDINFPSLFDDWKKFELKNKSIALNVLYVLYVPQVEKTVRHAYKSKYNLTRENQVILLMIGGGEKWHYLTVRSLSTLLKGITSKHKDDCFHSYPSTKSLEKHMKVCENKDYCYIEMPEKGESLKYQPGVKSMKALYIIVADIESLLRKMDTCANDPSKSSTETKNEHEMCGCSLFIDCSFDKKNKLDYYSGKDSLKRFCQDLKKQARSIIDFLKKRNEFNTRRRI